MPACAAVNDSVQRLAGLLYETSEQHKDNRESRVIRDMNDTTKVLQFLLQRNPFNDDSCLVNIVTGVEAVDYVNVDNARSIGQQIIASMNGQNVEQLSLKKKDQAVTMDSKSFVRVNEEKVEVTSQLLFQRLSVIARDSEEDTATMFSYELSIYPASLFEAPGKMLKSQKSILGDYLWSLVGAEAGTIRSESNMVFVLDGGALLHRIPWKAGSSFGHIINSYCSYVTSHYNASAVIVFDGYEGGPSTKDSIHVQRAKSRQCVSVHFTDSTKLTIKKEDFLSNAKNKQKIVYSLSSALKANGHTCINATQDADLLIVKTAVQHAKLQQTCVVGDDTDLLVLLCHQAESSLFDIYFAPEDKTYPSGKKGVRCWNIKGCKEIFGDKLCRHLLFHHAFLGCDTTSRIHGFGKSATIKLLNKQLSFAKTVDVFLSSKSSFESIVAADETILLNLYNAPKHGQLLNAI